MSLTDTYVLVAPFSLDFLMIRKRLRHRSVKHAVSVKDWTNTLLDVPCYLVGNGPSLEDLAVHKLDDYFTIGINRTFLAIDPTILLWQDIELWYTERRKVPRLKAIKYCRDIADPSGLFYNFALMGGGYKLPKHGKVLFGRGSSGPLAFQLAYVLGCNPIVLLGMDCCYRNDKTNFYGKNPHHKPHTLPSCAIGLKWIKGAEHNRTVIDCSCNNIFKEKRNFNNVVEELKPLYTLTGRDYFTNKIFNGKGP